MKKKIFLIFAVALFGLVALSTAAAVAPSETNENNIIPMAVSIGVSWGGGGGTGEGPPITVDDLQVGDLICQVGGDKSLIPGRYDHVQMYVGNGQVIESIPSTGVHYTAVSDGDVFRVSTSSSVKQAAVDWAETKIGLSYDYWLVSKQVNGNTYYCSELCWAAYLSANGPDIDQHPGWSWTYANAVAPTECADDGDTYLVGTL